MRTNARVCPVSGTLVTREITVRSFEAMTPQPPISFDQLVPGTAIGLGQAELPGDRRWFDANLEGGAPAAAVSGRKRSGRRDAG
jgi:hypothetical protein